MDVVRFHEEWNETLYCSNQFFKFYYHRKLFLNRVGCKTQQTYYFLVQTQLYFTRLSSTKYNRYKRIIFDWYYYVK